MTMTEKEFRTEMAKVARAIADLKSAMRACQQDSSPVGCGVGLFGLINSLLSIAPKGVDTVVVRGNVRKVGPFTDTSFVITGEDLRVHLEVVKPSSDQSV